MSIGAEGESTEKSSETPQKPHTTTHGEDPSPPDNTVAMTVTVVIQKDPDKKVIKDARISLKRSSISPGDRMKIMQAALLTYPESKYRPPGYYSIIEPADPYGIVPVDADQHSTTAEKTEIYWPLDNANPRVQVRRPLILQPGKTQNSWLQHTVAWHKMSEATLLLQM